MSPEFFFVTILLVVIGLMVVEWRRGWRDISRISPTRDRRVELLETDDGRPRPGVSDVADVGADASCGGDAGGD